MGHVTEKPIRLVEKVALVAGAFSLFFVAVMLCLSAAMPPPDWGWSVTTPFSPLLSANLVRVTSGIMAGFGLILGLVARRPLYFAFFIPALLVATLPYKNLSLETALLRNPIAFDREWTRQREEPSEADVAGVNGDVARRSKLLEEPDTAWRRIGSMQLLDLVVGVQALKARKSQWSNGDYQAASDVLSVPTILIPDIAPATQRVLAAQNALAAKKETHGEWIEDCTRTRSRLTDAPCGGRYAPPNTDAETAELTSAVADEATLKAKVEAAKSEEATRIEAARSTLSRVSGLAKTFEVAGGAASNWFWTIFISASTLALIVVLGVVDYRLAIWGLGTAISLTGGIAALFFGGAAPVVPPAWGFTAILPILMSVAILSVAATSGAIIGRLLEENLPLLWKITKIRRGRVLGDSGLKWMPLMACIVAGSFLAAWLVNKAYGYAYNIPVATAQVDGCGTQQKRLVFELLPPARDLETDIDYSVSCQFEGALKAARDANSASAQQSVNAVGSAGEMALAAVNRVIPTSLPCDADGHNIPSDGGTCVSDAFNYPECKWYQLVCKAKRIPHRVAERSYANARADAIGWVSNKVQAIKAKIAAEAPIAQAQVDALAVEAFENVSVEVRTGLWQGFRVWDAAHAAAFVIFAIAACKSAGYVFARVYYSQRPLRMRSTAFVSEPHITVSSSPSYDLRKPGTYYLKLGADPGEVAPKGPWFPQPTKLLFSRFPFRTLFNFFILKEGRHVPLSEKGTGRFIEIEIAPSKPVAFYPQFLYAWSDTVKFSTKWSFRLPNLLRGRISTSTASGSGRIILYSKGPVKAIDGNYEGEGYPPTRLIAWSSDMDITASSDANLGSIYFSGILIRPQGNSFAVFDAGSRMIFPGALRFIPVLLSPF